MKYFLLLACLTGISIARKLPSFIEVCKPKHTDVGECIKRNIENLKPRFKNGIPEMMIPSFDPYTVPSATVKLGDNFEASVTDLKLYLPKSFIVEDLKFDSDNVTLYLKIKIPEVNAVCDYSLKGKLLVLNLNGAGPGTINLTDIEAEVTSFGKKELRKGKYYAVLTDMDIKPKVKSMSAHLENLFPNNEELTDSANKLFNENQSVLIEDFSPVIVKVVKQFINSFLGNFFSRYSLDVLFPDD